MVGNTVLKKPFKPSGKIGIPRNTIDRRFSVAPMMDWSDRHCRMFWRCLSKHAYLYTEMVTTGAILHGDSGHHLQHSPREYPLALQLGGNDPVALAKCSQLAESMGYQEVNLNVGCPSDRVKNGSFGACLMAEPELVRDCMSAMIEQCNIPITIKHRIGIDDNDSYNALSAFVSTVADSGCTTFIVHARKAILQGLSPKQNREIPPLQYDTVYQLKKDFPHLEIIINGGIEDCDAAAKHLQSVDGAMLGRAAYHNPQILLDVDSQIYGNGNEAIDVLTALKQYYGYIQDQLDQGEPLNRMGRHILGAFKGTPGAKQFRRYLSENMHHKNAGLEVIDFACTLIEDQ